MRVEVIVLCVYFIGMIAMGLYWNKKAKSSEDFMLEDPWDLSLQL